MSLVARVREGSEEAKRILWDLYQPVFLRHAQHHQSLRHLRRTHDAEDLTQEAWRRVFAYDAMDRFRYRGQGSLGHFLKDIVEKTILDCVRAMQAVKRAGERADIELAETALAGGGMTASALSAAAASELMERCKELLDATEWFVFERCELVGEPSTAVSQALGISAGSVRRRLHKARIRIRRAFEASCRPPIK